MEYKSGFVEVGTEQLHYLRMGEGKRLLIAFPGYGNEASLFAPFRQYLKDEYTLICIDLPHHGQSKWPRDKIFSIEQLHLLIDNLKRDFGAEKVSLMGYSIGGRVCLCIMEQMPAIIDKVVLIAPDGLVFNYGYNFVTRNFLGKMLFRNFLKNIKRYLPFVDWLKARGIISASRYKFGMHYLQTEESRDFLLQVWPGMRMLVPHIGKLKAIINKYAMRVHIVIGAHDRVILPAHAQQFVKNLKTADLHIVDKGHHILEDGMVPEIAQYFLS